MSDSMAKFGSGSLLTATVALLIGGSTTWFVVGIAVTTLLTFLVSTMFTGVFEVRAARHEDAAERIAAALKEIPS